MAQTTITLSFDVCALVPDALPGVEALRSALEDVLPDDWWSSEFAAGWWLEHVNTTPPQHQPVNAKLLECCLEALTAYEVLGHIISDAPQLASSIPGLSGCRDRVNAAIATAQSD